MVSHMIFFDVNVCTRHYILTIENFVSCLNCRGSLASYCRSLLLIRPCASHVQHCASCAVRFATPSNTETDPASITFLQREHRVIDLAGRSAILAGIRGRTPGKDERRN